MPTKKPAIDTAALDIPDAVRAEIDELREKVGVKTEREVARDRVLQLLQAAAGRGRVGLLSQDCGARRGHGHGDRPIGRPCQ